MGKLGGEASGEAQQAAARVAASRGIDLKAAVKREQPVEPPPPPAAQPPVRGQYPPVPGRAQGYDPRQRPAPPVYDPRQGPPRPVGSAAAGRPGAMDGAGGAGLYPYPDNAPTIFTGDTEVDTGNDYSESSFPSIDVSRGSSNDAFTDPRVAMRQLADEDRFWQDGHNFERLADPVNGDPGRPPGTTDGDVAEKEAARAQYHMELKRIFKDGTRDFVDANWIRYRHSPDGTWRRQDNQGRWEDVDPNNLAAMVQAALIPNARQMAAINGDYYRNSSQERNGSPRVPADTPPSEFRAPTARDLAGRMLSPFLGPDGRYWANGLQGRMWFDDAIGDWSRDVIPYNDPRLQQGIWRGWPLPDAAAIQAASPNGYADSRVSSAGRSADTPVLLVTDTRTSDPLGARGTDREADLTTGSHPIDLTDRSAADEATQRLQRPEDMLTEERVGQVVGAIEAIAPAINDTEISSQGRQQVIDAYQGFEDTLRALSATTDPQIQARVLRELGMPVDTDLHLNPDTVRELFVVQIVEQLNRERRGEERTIEQIQNEALRLEAARDEAERTGGKESTDYIKLRDERMYLNMLQQELNQQFLRFELPEVGNDHAAPLLITALDAASRDHSITNLQEVDRLRQQWQSSINTHASLTGEEPYELPSAEELMRAFRRFEQIYSRGGHYSVESTEAGGIQFQKLVSLREGLDSGTVQNIRSHFLEIINSRVPALVGNDLESFVRNAPPETQGVMGGYLEAVNANGPELQAVRELFAQRAYSERFMEAAQRLLDLPEPLDPSTEEALEAIRSMEDTPTRPTERAIMQAYLYRFVHLVSEYRATPDPDGTIPVPQIALLTFAATEEALGDYIGERYEVAIDDSSSKTISTMRALILQLNDQLNPRAIQALGQFDERLRSASPVRSTVNTA